MQTTQRLTEAFAAGLSISVNEVTDELHYQSIPEWDSVSHLFLISELEKTFNISIETEDILSMTSVLETKKILTRYHIQFN